MQSLLELFIVIELACGPKVLFWTNVEYSYNVKYLFVFGIIESVDLSSSCTRRS